MEQLNQYKLERYKAAFRDYEAACKKFHEGVLALGSQNERTTATFDTLTRDLNIKHNYVVECAIRLVKTM